MTERITHAVITGPREARVPMIPLKQGAEAS
jgi:hypothetical protein